MANNPTPIYPVIKHDESLNYILCPVCGDSFKPNDRNLCLNCLSNEIDISADIMKKNPKLIPIKQCDSCKRWYNKSISKWKITEIGSPDLKDILLKKVKGLHKKENRILKSSFINIDNTQQPIHSKKITIEIHLQSDTTFDDKQNILTLDKVFPIDFKIESVTCKECNISSDLYSTWKSCVQIRQNNMNNYRLFLFLEQLLIKHHHESFVNCINIEQQKNGLDFYFEKETMSKMFINHLHDIIAVNANFKKQHTANMKNCGKDNIQKYKTKYYGELPCICANDLCLMPVKLQKKCGGNSPLMICEKISSSLHFIDPSSLHRIELDCKQYFRYNFQPIASLTDLCLFYVISVNRIEIKNVQLWEIELVRESDLGHNNDEILESITNLNWLKDGDMIEGYDINKLSNTVDLFGNELKKYRKKNKVQDVIIVQKYYDFDSIKCKRKWKLKGIDNIKMADGYKMDKYMKEKRMIDYEIFLNQLKLHKHLRAQINIYKNEEYNEDEEKDNDNDENDLDDIDDSELISETPLNVKEKDVEMDNDNDK